MNKYQKLLFDDLRDDYGVIFNEGKMSLKERGGKVNEYVNDKEVLVLSNIPLGHTQNEYGVTKNSVRSTISKAVHLITNSFKNEMTYREGEVLMNVDTVAIVDHNNGYMELMLFSEKLDNSVAILMRSNHDNMILGTITG